MSLQGTRLPCWFIGGGEVAWTTCNLPAGILLVFWTAQKKKFWISNFIFIYSLLLNPVKGVRAWVCFCSCTNSILVNINFICISFFFFSPVSLSLSIPLLPETLFFSCEYTYTYIYIHIFIFFSCCLLKLLLLFASLSLFLPLCSRCFCVMFYFEFS